MQRRHTESGLEGAAINDFQYPDRVVVGVRSPHAEETLKELYAPFLRTDKPFLAMTPESATDFLGAGFISVIASSLRTCHATRGGLRIKLPVEYAVSGSSAQPRGVDRKCQFR